MSTATFDIDIPQQVAFYSVTLPKQMVFAAVATANSGKRRLEEDYLVAEEPPLKKPRPNASDEASLDKEADLIEQLAGPILHPVITLNTKQHATFDYLSTVPPAGALDSANALLHSGSAQTYSTQPAMALPAGGGANNVHTGKKSTVASSIFRALRGVPKFARHAIGAVLQLGRSAPDSLAEEQAVCPSPAVQLPQPEALTTGPPAPAGISTPSCQFSMADLLRVLPSDEQPGDSSDDQSIGSSPVTRPLPSATLTCGPPVPVGTSTPSGELSLAELVAALPVVEHCNGQVTQGEDPAVCPCPPAPRPQHKALPSGLPASASTSATSSKPTVADLPSAPLSVVSSNIQSAAMSTVRPCEMSFNGPPIPEDAISSGLMPDWMTLELKVEDIYPLNDLPTLGQEQLLHVLWPDLQAPSFPQAAIPPATMHPAELQPAVIPTLPTPDASIVEGVFQPQRITDLILNIDQFVAEFSAQNWSLYQADRFTVFNTGLPTPDASLSSIFPPADLMAVDRLFGFQNLGQMYAQASPTNVAYTQDVFNAGLPTPDSSLTNLSPSADSMVPNTLLPSTGWYNSHIGVHCVTDQGARINDLRVPGTLMIGDIYPSADYTSTDALFAGQSDGQVHAQLQAMDLDDAPVMVDYGAPTPPRSPSSAAFLPLLPSGSLTSTNLAPPQVVHIVHPYGGTRLVDPNAPSMSQQAEGTPGTSLPPSDRSLDIIPAPPAHPISVNVLLSRHEAEHVNGANEIPHLTDAPATLDYGSPSSQAAVLSASAAPALKAACSTPSSTGATSAGDVVSATNGPQLVKTQASGTSPQPPSTLDTSVPARNRLFAGVPPPTNVEEVDAQPGVQGAKQIERLKGWDDEGLGYYDFPDDMYEGLEYPDDMSTDLEAEDTPSSSSSPTDHAASSSTPSNHMASAGCGILPTANVPQHVGTHAASRLQAAETTAGGILATPVVSSTEIHPLANSAEVDPLVVEQASEPMKEQAEIDGQNMLPEFLDVRACAPQLALTSSPVPTTFSAPPVGDVQITADAPQQIEMQDASRPQDAEATRGGRLPMPVASWPVIPPLANSAEVDPLGVEQAAQQMEGQTTYGMDLSLPQPQPTNTLPGCQDDEQLDAPASESTHLTNGPDSLNYGLPSPQRSSVSASTPLALEVTCSTRTTANPEATAVGGDVSAANGPEDVNILAPETAPQSTATLDPTIPPPDSSMADVPPPAHDAAGNAVSPLQCTEQIEPSVGRDEDDHPRPSSSTSSNPTVTVGSDILPPSSVPICGELQQIDTQAASRPQHVEVTSNGSLPTPVVSSSKIPPPENQAEVDRRVAEQIAQQMQQHAEWMEELTSRMGYMSLGLPPHLRSMEAAYERDQAWIQSTLGHAGKYMRKSRRTHPLRFQGGVRASPSNLTNDIIGAAAEAEVEADSTLLIRQNAEQARFESAEHTDTSSSEYSRSSCSSPPPLTVGSSSPTESVSSPEPFNRVIVGLRDRSPSPSATHQSRRKQTRADSEFTQAVFTAKKRAASDDGVDVTEHASKRRLPRPPAPLPWE